MNADKEAKVQLVLNGASIHSDTFAALYVLQADKVFVTLESGTENSLSNGGSFVLIDENEVDAVIYAKDDIVLNASFRAMCEANSCGVYGRCYTCPPRPRISPSSACRWAL